MRSSGARSSALRRGSAHKTGAVGSGVDRGVVALRPCSLRCARAACSQPSLHHTSHVHTLCLALSLADEPRQVPWQIAQFDSRPRALTCVRAQTLLGLELPTELLGVGHVIPKEHVVDIVRPRVAIEAKNPKVAFPTPQIGSIVIVSTGEADGADG